MTKKTEFQARQGDVLLTPIDVIPRDAIELVAQDGTVVLREGEATGHAHAFYRQPVKLYETPRKERYLHVVQTSYLKHEEHTQIEVPPGLYKLPTQTEWTDENEPRVVAD